MFTISGIVSIDDKVYVKVCRFENGVGRSISTTSATIDEIFAIPNIQLTATIRVLQRTDDIDPITGKNTYVDLAANGITENTILIKDIRPSEESELSNYRQLKECAKAVVISTMETIGKTYQDFLKDDGMSCDLTIKLAKGKNSKVIENAFSRVYAKRLKALA